MSFSLLKKSVFIFIGITVLAPVFAVADECSGQSKCILVIGNSITRHGPSTRIGWVGDWGMAATTAENDYVSQLIKLLSRNLTDGTWKAERVNAGLLETNPEKFQLTWSATQLSKKSNIVIIEAGDNFSLDNGSVDAFSRSYLQTLNTLRPQNGVLACVGTWWNSSAKNRIIRESCWAARGIYVDISGLSDFPENLAGAEQNIANKGVAAHPGDKGMKAIANRIFESIKQDI